MQFWYLCMSKPGTRRRLNCATGKRCVALTCFGTTLISGKPDYLLVVIMFCAIQNENGQAIAWPCIIKVGSWVRTSVCETGFLEDSSDHVRTCYKSVKA